MHSGYVVIVKDLKPHANADKLQLATFFGETTCVGLNVKEGDKGIYFPCDLQLSLEYCDANDLCRTKADGTAGSGYLERDKRNVKAIKLRGEKSCGMYMPLESLAFTGADLDSFQEGDIITVVNGIEICRKYIPRGNRSGASGGGGNRTRKHKEIKYPYFVEHIDTPQLRFNLSLFQAGDIICLTEKIHGTSSRNANTIKEFYKKNIFHRIFGLKGKKHREYENIAGTRRTIVKDSNIGFYGTNEFRNYWAELFKDKLLAGETVFGEIAGYYAEGCPIMATCNNNKTKDKEFIKIFGDTTTFSYGCSPEGNNRTETPLNKYYIYRMNYTTPNGEIIEYSWDQVKLRAEQMGFLTVPELERFIYTTEEDFLNRITKYLDIPSTIDSSHIIEGVVVRALNSPYFKVAKEKSYNFKVIEGIIKTEAEAPDMEEQEELL